MSSLPSVPVTLCRVTMFYETRPPLVFTKALESTRVRVGDKRYRGLKPPDDWRHALAEKTMQVEAVTRAFRASGFYEDRFEPLEWRNDAGLLVRPGDTGEE